VLNLAGAWEKAEEDESHIAWARLAWNDMKRFGTGGNYINFLTEDESQERVDAALGKSIRRLGEVKSKWDAKNIFRTNRNIRPA